MTPSCRPLLVHVTALALLLAASACTTTKEKSTRGTLEVVASNTKKPTSAYKMLPDEKGPFQADYALLHEESGVYHPLEIGPFTRRDGYRYRDDVVDFSFSYMTPEDQTSLKATVYVYPNGRGPTDIFSTEQERVAFMTAHLDETVSAFGQFYAEAEAISAEALTIKTQNDQLPWVMEEYRIVTRQPPIEERISWTYISVKGPWYIKYRISGPYNRRVEMRQLKDTFVESFTAQIVN